MLTRGTTPTVRFTFQTLNPNIMRSCFLTIKQKDDLIVEKDLTQGRIGTEERCGHEVYYVEWRLSQEETLRIDEKSTVDIQTRCLMDDNTAYASKVYTIRGYKVLKEGVI